MSSALRELLLCTAGMGAVLVVLMGYLEARCWHLTTWRQRIGSLCVMLGLATGSGVAIAFCMGAFS